MTPNERLLEQEIRHQIGLRRTSEATIRKAIAIINRTLDDLEQRLFALRLDELNQTKGLQAIDALIEAFRKKQDTYRRQLEALVAGDMEKLALYEAGFNARNIGASLSVGFNVPRDAAIIAAVNSRPFQGRFLKEWIKGLTDANAARVRDAVRIGFLEGQGVEAIVRRIRGTRARQYKDGVIEIARRDAQRIVRTALTHTANAASHETYRAASDVVVKVRYVAILDGRTSIICAGLDGKTFPIDSGPRPPQHPNCRSSTAAVIKGAPNPTRETYQDWLTRQPVSVQDEILGARKAKLFRAGLTIDRFTDRKGQVWDLSELERRESGLWMKAGLDD